MSTASRFKAFADLQTTHTVENGLAVMRWLSDNDPHGQMHLIQDVRAIEIKFTDGSRCLLDIKSGAIQVPN